MSCEFEENSKPIEIEASKSPLLKELLSNLPFYMEHSGENGCGGIAFYLKRKLINGDLLYDEDVVWPNGTPAQNQEPLICPECGGQIELKGDYIKSC